MLFIVFIVAKLVKLQLEMASERGASLSGNREQDAARSTEAIKISHIPFGFFETELLKYFSQFGRVRRVRVARNKKVSD